MILGVALGATGFIPNASAAEKKPEFSARNACDEAESWSYGKSFSSNWAGFKEEFEGFLGKRHSAVRGFSEAMALRRVADTSELQAFAEYWVSRALLRAGLYHIAHRGLTVIAARPVETATAGVQAAALDCLNFIHSKFPALDFSDEVTARLPEYSATLKGTRLISSVWNTAGSIVRSQLSRGSDAEAVRETMKAMEGSGLHLEFAKGLLASHLRKRSEAVVSLSKFVSDPGAIPRPLQRYLDFARVMLARSQYAGGAYDQAMLQLQKVSKSSNELARALNELAWAYLMADRQREAIGTAINLHSGGLRKTFTPESTMVLAMGLNELCRYPESIQAIQMFKRDYSDSYLWLKQWKAKESQDESLYKTAINYLRGERAPAQQENGQSARRIPVPAKIASEWIRSPLFIARQSEINLLFDEKQGSEKLGDAGASEQYKLAVELLKFAREFKKRYALAVVKLKPGQDLPPEISTDLERLRKQVKVYRHFRQAAPIWQRVLAAHQTRVKPIETRLVKEIESDLHRMTSRMYTQLDAVAENNHFIEVEIFNGASQDIIWQNAHPDYQKVVTTLKDEERKRNAAKVWDWGQVTSGFSGSGEIWEDELGSFAANLYDNCNSKDRYLAVIREKSKGGGK